MCTKHVQLVLLSQSYDVKGIYEQNIHIIPSDRLNYETYTGPSHRMGIYIQVEYIEKEIIVRLTVGNYRDQRATAAISRLSVLSICCF